MKEEEDEEKARKRRGAKHSACEYYFPLGIIITDAFLSLEQTSEEISRINVIP